MGMVMLFIVLPAVLFFVGVQQVKRAKKAKEVKRREERDKRYKDARKAAQAFMREPGSTAFSMNGHPIFSFGNLHIELDKERGLVILNRSIELNPREMGFLVETETRTHVYNTGGVQTFTTARGDWGSVYVPGELLSHSSTKIRSLRVVRVPEDRHDLFEDREFLQLESIKYVDGKLEKSGISDVRLETLVDVSGVAGDRKSDFTEIFIPRYSGHIVKHDDSTVGGTIFLFAREVEARRACAQAGLAEGYFSKFRGCLPWVKTSEMNDGTKRSWEKTVLVEGIAIDRTGRALLLQDDESWVGSLLDAKASIVPDAYGRFTLEVEVNDPAYRAQHMTNRCFSILHIEPREDLKEWEGRINLLAQTAQ